MEGGYLPPEEMTDEETWFTWSEVEDLKSTQQSDFTFNL